MHSSDVQAAEGSDSLGRSKGEEVDKGGVGGGGEGSEQESREACGQPRASLGAVHRLLAARCDA